MSNLLLRAVLVCKNLLTKNAAYYFIFERQYKKIIDKIKKMQVYKPGSVFQ